MRFQRSKRNKCKREKGLVYLIILILFITRYMISVSHNGSYTATSAGFAFEKKSTFINWHSFSAIVLTASHIPMLICCKLARIACWLECQTCDWKVVSSNPGRSGGRIFFSRVNFVCWLLFGVHSTSVLPQWHVKDPGHSAKSTGGRLHLNMHTPLTQRSWSGLTVPLSRHSVGIYLEMSSHASRQGTLSHSHLSSLSHFGLILALRVELMCMS